MESYLIVRIGSNKLGINVKDIHFVIRNNGIVPLPDMPDWMDGIISFRDKIIPVLNNKTKLKLKNGKEAGKRIILCSVGNNALIGVNVDESIAVLKDKEIDLTLNLDGEIIPVLNIKNILTGEQIEFIKKL